MENLKYKPDIYEGKDPYIYISFHQNDRERVLRILEKLDMRGFRFWIADGITPGMESDEIIAEHIENCEFFIAFLSKSYLEFLDTVDELNYSRDVNKSYLLIYLEDILLPDGLNMRFTHNVKAYAMNDDEIYEQLLNIDDADHFYGIADVELQDEAKKVFDKLEQLYPDHKVFALDDIDKQVSKEISGLYMKAGYPSVERVMLDYGFVHIGIEEARSLKNGVLYQPGYEPAIIKPRIDDIMETLTNYYPNKNISDELSKRHKSIYKSLLGLSVWLGYDSLADMLNAYGFSGVTSDLGRVASDEIAVIEQLEQRYEGKTKPTSVYELIYDNPDMKYNINIIKKRSFELFGMTFLQYLKMIGLIASNEVAGQSAQLAITRLQIIEDIKQRYDEIDFDYGLYNDVENTMNQIVVKRNKKNQIYVTDCSSSLETMNIPYGIDFINKDAFLGQSNLTTLILPPTVKEIKEGAFCDCDGLETIIFSEGLERIGNNAFAGCTSLTKLAFPKSLKVIGNEAFAGCEKLAQVQFINYRVNVQGDAFDDCIYELEALQDEGASPAEYFDLMVDKKNNAKIIAYSGKEEVVVIPGMIKGHPITSIEKGSFKGNEHIKEVYISDHIKAINGDAFKDCKNLKKVHISESLTTLKSKVFEGCINLTEVNIPDSMEEVTRGMFKDSPITTLYIGKATNYINPDAFYKGTQDITGRILRKKALESIIIDTGNDTFSVEGTMLLSRDGKKLIAELGNPIKAIIPEDVEEICESAYNKIASLSEVIFPSTLKRIREKAFANTNLKAVELPKSLRIIDEKAFYSCRLLTSLDVNEGLKEIGNEAFDCCPIKDVYIPASVEKIGNSSFISISANPEVNSQRFRIDTSNAHFIADGVALYQKSEDNITLIKAYHKGLRLKSDEEGGEGMDYSIMKGTTIIASSAFALCNNLKSIIIPEGVRIIEDKAFLNCKKLKLPEVRIPKSCIEVSESAFFGITFNKELKGEDGKLKRQPIYSSNIASAGYDATQQILEIEFNSGAVWRYPSFPEKMWYEFLGAPSQGKYFYSQILPRFKDLGYSVV